MDISRGPPPPGPSPRARFFAPDCVHCSIFSSFCLEMDPIQRLMAVEAEAQSTVAKARQGESYGATTPRPCPHHARTPPTPPRTYPPPRAPTLPPAAKAAKIKMAQEQAARELRDHRDALEARLGGLAEAAAAGRDAAAQRAAAEADTAEARLRSAAAGRAPAVVAGLVSVVLDV